MHVVYAGSRPCSAERQQQQQWQLPPAPGQQQQQPPWLAGGSAAAGGITNGSNSISRGPSSTLSAGSSRPSSAAVRQQQQGDADWLSAQLSSNVQLASGLLGVVGEVEEYSADYELWLRALLKSGGGSSVEAGKSAGFVSVSLGS